MLQNKWLEDVSGKISQLISETPASDVEKNLRALLQAAFAKLDLVTREEFDAQAQVLVRAREQLTMLEKKLGELEARLASRE